ncbi:MAG: hypothetical protein EA379_08650, partial [Phycisphaerales bacterium]
PARVYQGAGIVFAGFTLQYATFVLNVTESVDSGAIGRFFGVLPMTGGYGLVALGMGFIIVGCIDYARART